MFPPFKEDTALEKCRWLLERLDAGELELRQLAPLSGERAGQGLMLAAMIAREAWTGPDRLFFACSGLSRQLFVVNPRLEGLFQIAPPIVAPEAIAAALAKNDRAIHELTARLQEGGEGATLSAEKRQFTKKSAHKRTELDCMVILYNCHPITELSPCCPKTIILKKPKTE